MQLTREALELCCETKDECPVELLGLPAAPSGASADPLVGSDQLVEPRCALLSPTVQRVGTQGRKLYGVDGTRPHRSPSHRAVRHGCTI